MSTPLRLRTLRLVNWHNFTDETLHVDGSLFLIGDNGCGKTTLLDAVHCALTGNLDVELNAAARVGGRRDEGRTLAGIVLRHDLEAGWRRPDGAVAYTALELVGDGGRSVSIGVGAFVASPESRPELWGFIVPCPLAEVPLVLGDAADRRPADRSELAARLPAGAVTDIGRYRTRVGERLFAGREGLEQVAAFLAAGKAYRELVARTANFSELFARLLPAPDAAAFEEIRRALAALERTRADLAALEDELARLRSLLGWQEEIDRQREALARYDYLAARFAHDSAKLREEACLSREQQAAAALARAHEARATLDARQTAIEGEGERLRGTEDAALLERWQTVTRERDRQAHEVTRREQVAGEAEAESKRREVGASEAAAQVVTAARAAATTLAEVRELAAASVRTEALHAAGRLAEALEALATTSGAALDGTRAEADRNTLRQAIAERVSAERGDETAASVKASEAEAAATALEEMAARLASRGEVEPPLAGLGAAIAALDAVGISATPLYHVLEPAAEVDLAAAGQLERVLGRRRLGTLVVAATDHEAAQALLLERHPGIPLAECGDAAHHGDLPGSLAARLVVRPDQPAAAAFVRHHLGGIAWVEATRDGEFLSRDGHLHAARADERLALGPARWLGAAARRRALDDELAQLSAKAAAARDLARQHRDRAARAAARAAGLERAMVMLERVGLVDLASHVARAGEASRAAAAGVSRLSERRDELREARARLEELASTFATLELAVRDRQLGALAERLVALDAERRLVQAEQHRANNAEGRGAQARDEAARALAQATRDAGAAAAALRAARERVVERLPPEGRADVDDFVLRVRRGRQVKTENLQALRDDAVRQKAALVDRISHGEGVQHRLLWQKYAFVYAEDENRLTDSRGKSAEEVTTSLQGEVDELGRALKGRSDELLERVVLEDLVGTLRREVFGLEDTIRKVNRLVAGLTFGPTRYRINASLRSEVKRLHSLLKDASALGLGAREELKAYFGSRLDELNSADDDGLPALLDYRRWFDFTLQMATVDAAGVELSRERLRQGSGGEQAVPNYLLLFCLTTLLYDGIDSRLRLLLLDEAFYGIDAGRRDALLRFCAQAGIDLVVATPEMDGVTESLAASTTVLIERSPAGDVFLHDYRFVRKAETLFESARPDPAELVLGVREGGT